MKFNVSSVPASHYWLTVAVIFVYSYTVISFSICVTSVQCLSASRGLYPASLSDGRGFVNRVTNFPTICILLSRLQIVEYSSCSPDVAANESSVDG